MNKRIFLVTTFVSLLFLILTVIFIVPLIKINNQLLKGLLIFVYLLYAFSLPFSILSFSIDPNNKRKNFKEKHKINLDEVTILLNIIFAPYYIIELFIYEFKRRNKNGQ